VGFTTLASQRLLNAFCQNVAITGQPATHYVGLIGAATWQSLHAYTSGQYVIPTTFGAIAGQQGKIFKCTISGTSAASEPTWPTSEGGTVVDGGTLQWTEVSLLFQAGTFTGAEISGNNYSRVAVTANSANFPNASNAEPSIVQNGTAITFPTPSADWGPIAGFTIADASTTGNIWFWGAMTSALNAISGSTPSFGTSTLSLSMSAVQTA
jgi:hypothetical protein